jgi:putative flippase GtrA
MTRLRRLVWFGIVGGSAAALYGVQVYVYANVWGWSAVRGSTIAYLVCGLVSYSGNRLLTFQSEAPLAPEASRFVATSLIGMAISAFIPLLLTQYLHFDAWVSFLLVCISVPTANYFLLSRFVYVADLRNATS